MTNVHLHLATFASETSRAGATEIVQEICAVGTKKAGLVGTVIHIIGAKRSFPSRRADALETSLFERNALSSVGARFGSTRVQCATAVSPSITRATEAGKIVWSRFVLAHGAIIASCRCAARFLFLTLETRVARWAGASVTLAGIFSASTAIVARTRITVVDVHFAESASESCGAVASGHVSHGEANAAVATQSFLADDWLTLVASFGAFLLRLSCGRAFDTRHFAFGWLEKVERASSTRC